MLYTKSTIETKHFSKAKRALILLVTSVSCRSINTFLLIMTYKCICISYESAAAEFILGKAITY